MSLKGDLSNLSRFQAAIRTIGSGLLANRVASLAAPKLTRLAKATAAASQTAEGVPWRPSPNGQKVTLRKSGAMLSRLVYVAIGSKLRVALTARYARYQIGRRPVFPTQTSALPDTYRKALDESVAEAFEGVLP